MKIYKIGVAIIIVNSKNEFLLQQRDYNPNIKYPGTWVLFGGGVHKNEKPENAVIREIYEEMNIDISNFSFYKNFKYEDEDEEHLQYIYFKQWDIETNLITLNEGLGLTYFSRDALKNLELGFNIKDILNDYCTNYIP